MNPCTEGWAPPFRACVCDSDAMDGWNRFFRNTKVRGFTLHYPLDKLQRFKIQ